jgi:hypothetical protein
MRLAVKLSTAATPAMLAITTSEPPQLARLTTIAMTEVRLRKSPVVASASDTGAAETGRSSTRFPLILAEPDGHKLPRFGGNETYQSVARFRGKF